MLKSDPFYLAIRLCGPSCTVAGLQASSAYRYQAYSRSFSGFSQLFGHVIRLNVDNFVRFLQLTVRMERQRTTPHRCGIFKQGGVVLIQVSSFKTRAKETSPRRSMTGLLTSWYIVRLNSHYVSVAPSTARYYLASIYPSRTRNARSTHAQE